MVFIKVNWVRIYNRIFKLIDTQGSTYYSGPAFIAKIHEVDPHFPNYSQYIDQRRKCRKSTSRRDYFYDILLEFDEVQRCKIINSILDDIEGTFPEETAIIRSELSGLSAVPHARVDPDSWNADRLNEYIEEIDRRIAAERNEGAVTLAYTCLEGYLKAFIKKRIPDYSGKDEIIHLSRAVQGYLRENIKEYPDEGLNMLNHIAHTVDRTRNRFSESHFDQKAGRWLAIFIRDLVNTEIRLLMHFL